LWSTAAALMVRAQLLRGYPVLFWDGLPTIHVKDFDCHLESSCPLRTLNYCQAHTHNNSCWPVYVIIWHQ
jgi:hypothetical protein